MPAPTSSLATLRPDLGDSMEEFDLAADRQGFIGPRVYPVFETAEAGGTFGKIPVEQLLHDADDTTRSPRGGYNRGDWEFVDEAFATKEQGWEEPVDDNEARMYRHYFDAERVAAQRAIDVVLRNGEKRIAAAVFNATTYASQKTTITNEWDANHTSDAVPVTDVKNACESVWDQCGMWPNAIIFNRHVFRNVRELDQILDRIAASGAGDKIRARDVTVAQLSAVFDLPYVFVAGSAKNTAKEGQSVAFSEIWSSEYAMVCRVAETDDIREPCIGRTLHWAEDGSVIGGAVETYRDENVRGDIVRCRHQVGEKAMYIECAHLLENVTTSS